MLRRFVTGRCSIIFYKLILHLWMKSFRHPFVSIFSAFTIFFSLVLKYCYTRQVFHLLLSSDPKMLREVVSRTINCGLKFHTAQFCSDNSCYVGGSAAFTTFPNIPSCPRNLLFNLHMANFVDHFKSVSRE